MITHVIDISRPKSPPPAQPLHTSSPPLTLDTDVGPKSITKSATNSPNARSRRASYQSSNTNKDKDPKPSINDPISPPSQPSPARAWGSLAVEHTDASSLAHSAHGGEIPLEAVQQNLVNTSTTANKSMHSLNLSLDLSVDSAEKSSVPSKLKTGDIPTPLSGGSSPHNSDLSAELVETLSDDDEASSPSKAWETSGLDDNIRHTKHRFRSSTTTDPEAFNKGDDDEEVVVQKDASRSVSHSPVKAVDKSWIEPADTFDPAAQSEEGSEDGSSDQDEGEDAEMLDISTIQDTSNIKAELTTPPTPSTPPIQPLPLSVTPAAAAAAAVADSHTHLIHSPRHIPMQVNLEDYPSLRELGISLSTLEHTRGRLGVKCIEGQGILPHPSNTNTANKTTDNIRLDPFIKLQIMTKDIYHTQHLIPPIDGLDTPRADGGVDGGGGGQWKMTVKKRKLSKNPNFNNELIHFYITDMNPYILHQNYDHSDIIREQQKQQQQLIELRNTILLIEVWNCTTLRDVCIGQAAVSLLACLTSPYKPLLQTVPLAYPSEGSQERVQNGKVS